MFLNVSYFKAFKVSSCDETLVCSARREKLKSILVLFLPEFLFPPFCEVSTEKLLTRQKVFPLSGKVLDKLRSYGPNIFSSIYLVNLSKCFLANRENFFPYEQALIVI